MGSNVAIDEKDRGRKYHAIVPLSIFMNKRLNLFIVIYCTVYKKTMSQALNHIIITIIS